METNHAKSWRRHLQIVALADARLNYGIYYATRKRTGGLQKITPTTIEKQNEVHAAEKYGVDTNDTQKSYGTPYQKEVGRREGKTW